MKFVDDCTRDLKVGSYYIVPCVKLIYPLPFGRFKDSFIPIIWDEFSKKNLLVIDNRFVKFIFPPDFSIENYCNDTIIYKRRVYNRSFEQLRQYQSQRSIRNKTNLKR